jgi:hypothetical protein
MAATSSSGVEILLISNFSIRVFATLGDRNPGRVGPRRIPSTPRESKANRTRTAFCSYQELLGHSKIETTMQYSRLSNIKAQKDYYETMDKVMLGEYAKL